MYPLVVDISVIQKYQDGQKCHRIKHNQFPKQSFKGCLGVICFDKPISETTLIELYSLNRV